MLVAPAVAVSLAIAVANSSYDLRQQKLANQPFPPKIRAVVPQSEDTGSFPGRYMRDPTWPNLCVLFSDKARRKVPECLM